MFQRDTEVNFPLPKYNPYCLILVITVGLFAAAWAGGGGGAVRSHWTLLNCKHSGRTLSLFRRPLYPTLLVIRVFVGACLGTCRVVSTNYKVTWRLLRASR